MLGRFIRALLRPIAAQYGLFVALLLRNTGSGYGYVLTALRAYAYAIALSRALRSIRALCHPGVALRLPRAVFWRPFRALYSPIAKMRKASFATDWQRDLGFVVIVDLL